MASKHKGHAKHPASDHLRAAADALDTLHQQMGQQPQGQPLGPPGSTAPAGPMPGGVSPLGGVAQ